MSGHHVVLPGLVADRIVACGSRWGAIDLRIDRAESLLVVSGFSKENHTRHALPTPWLQSHYSRHVDAFHGVALWYRVSPGLHRAGLDRALRHTTISTEKFRDHVLGGWRLLPPDRPIFALTFEQDEDSAHHWSGWWLSREGAQWIFVEVIDESAHLLDPLASGWPLSDLEPLRVTVVGVGSVGSSAAESLATYGIRTFSFVDPDRLHQHNFARHRVHPRELGRHKVNALADRMLDRDPDLRIERFPVDVIEDADVMRPLFDRSEIVLICSDGVASRRVANHLARRANIPAVFACVLEDGAIGEILRTRPWKTECLLCFRERLREDGQLDPEPGIDSGYETGGQHRGMTAVTGDLALVGDFAAKATIATLMETRGDWGQRPPGDHLVIGLRPLPGITAPFDVARAGEVKWNSLGPPRAGCPTCSTS